MCGTTSMHRGSYVYFFFFSSRRRHTRLVSDWSSDVCSSDLHVRALHARADDRRCPGDDVVEIAGDQRLYRARAAGNEDHVRRKAVLREEPAVARHPEEALPRIDGDVGERELFGPERRGSESNGEPQSPDEEPHAETIIPARCRVSRIGTRREATGESKIRMSFLSLSYSRLAPHASRLHWLTSRPAVHYFRSSKPGGNVIWLKISSPIRKSSPRRAPSSTSTPGT